MRKRVFVTQQESTAPPERCHKPFVATVKLPKRRGRPKSLMNLQRFLFYSRVMAIATSGKKYTREEFAAALGYKPYCVNTMTSAFIRTKPEVNVANRERQEKIDRRFCKKEQISCIPILNSKEILTKTYPPVKKGMEAFPIPKEPKYGKHLHYFGFIMPDNCMLMDGICKGDRIAAVRNIRPCDGDLVACRIPKTTIVTVRRFAETSNPALRNLYEGGSLNPFWILDSENLIQGVVVGVVRDYWPGKMPRQWEPLREVPPYVTAGTEDAAPPAEAKEEEDI